MALWSNNMPLKMDFGSPKAEVWFHKATEKQKQKQNSPIIRFLPLARIFESKNESSLKSWATANQLYFHYWIVVNENTRFWWHSQLKPILLLLLFLLVKNEQDGLDIINELQKLSSKKGFIFPHTEEKGNLKWPSTQGLNISFIVLKITFFFFLFTFKSLNCRHFLTSS